MKIGIEFDHKQQTHHQISLEYSHERLQHTVIDGIDESTVVDLAVGEICVFLGQYAHVSRCY